MNRNHDSMDERIERAARDLPSLDPPEALWSRIHGRLLREQQQTVDDDRVSLPPRLLERVFGKHSSRFAIAIYSLVLLLGIGASVYLLSVKTQNPGIEAVQEGPLEMEAPMDIQEDIEQAMFYYERAIEKLSHAIDKQEPMIEAELLEAQRERVAFLRASIAECKRALEENKQNPYVQHYLLTAYNDLQEILQELTNPKTTM